MVSRSRRPAEQGPPVRLTRTGLRIVAGSLRGRRLETPDWAGLRPSGDRLRETLFNVLGQDLSGWRVLDAFAGTGAVGIEALSRGAAHALFVDRDARALDLVSRNLARCELTDRHALLRATLGEATGPALTETFDLIFLDPPYEVSPVGAVGQLESALAPDGLLVVEYARGQRPPRRMGGLERFREVTAGGSALGFYRRRARRDQDEALAS